jgi:diaminopimelate decarboxylase
MVSTHPTEVQHTGTQYLPQKRSQNANVSPNQELLPLTAKVNSQDILEIGGCDVTTLVEQFGSPCIF